MLPSSVKVTPGHERVREWRRRIREGAVSVRLEIGGPVLDLLCDEGFLRWEEQKNPESVAAALNRYLADEAQ